MYYLKKSAKRPTSAIVLTHEQQMEFFKRIETAKLRIEELNEYPEAHPGEIKHWEKQAEAARTAIILGNQGLVHSIAKKYEKRMEYDDLTQAGSIGLMTAVDKFEYRLGYALSTYATIWIRQAIIRTLSKQSRTIRIPEGPQAEIRKLKAVKAELLQEFGYKPSAEEVASVMDVPVCKVLALLAMDQQTVSLDAPLGDSDGATFGAFIEDDFAANPADGTDASFLNELHKEALETLTKREREVLDLRHGNNEGREHTLDEIGRIYGVSRERIRQIQHTATQKVRRFVKAKDSHLRVNIVKAAGAVQRLKNSSPLAVMPSAVSVTKPTVYRLKMRAVEKNPNHHITNNNGTWYCKFTLELAAGGKTEVRNSLHTHNVEDARKRRDKFILLYKVLSGVSAA